MRVPFPVACLLALAVSSPLLPSAQTLPLPGCEAAPQVRKTIDQKLDYQLMDKMKYTDRIAYERKVLEELMTRYPRELRPVLTYENLLDQDSPDDYTALRDRLVKAANDHPGDPFALVVAGKVLIDHNTPQAIKMLEDAHSKAPNFAWPDLYLAQVYSTGKRADAAKTKQNLEAFFAVCPSSTDHTAEWLLNKDQPLQPSVAAALRVRLQREKDPKELEEYPTLWGLEFRTHSPKDHDVVRAQVASDLKRLETLNPHGDVDWQQMLVTGYKQSGATKETVTAMEDRLVKAFPTSEEAYEIAYDRWDKAHKKPEDQTDKTAWAAYEKEHKEALKGWIHDYPDNGDLQRNGWFFAIYADDGIPEKEGIAAVDAFLDSVDNYDGPSMQAYYTRIAAWFLLNNKWQPERALDLVQKAKAANAKENAKEADSDNRSDESIKNDLESQAEDAQSFDGLILRAAIESGHAEPALKLKSEIEAPVPQDKKLVSEYWHNRGRLEAIEKHPQDALAYYQLALTTRSDVPKPYRGKVTDDLTDDARALWKQQGGSEVAWAVWSKPPAGAEQTSEGRWEKATKQIPDFELSDMTGKTWKLKELGGKTLLINLWATWCGPCQAELPALEKFYEKNKDRKDIQILTFDLDEDLGVVEPFIKEKGFTFPVLPAYSTVVGLLDGFAIPQTWLVDQHGVWQSKQIGFGGGSAADFEKDMLQRIDSAKGGQ